MKIAYFITKDSKLFGLTDVIDMLEGANNLAKVFGLKQNLFDVSVIGMDKKPIKFSGNFRVLPDHSIKESKGFDAIIIPAFEKGNFRAYLEKYTSGVDWLKSQFEKGTTLIGLCSGAFLVAATGLLDGKNCTTHWVAKNEFQELFPKVNLEIQYILVKEKGIITSGGSTNALYAILYLINQHFGRTIAQHCAKLYEIELGRFNQSQFEIFMPNKLHLDASILAAQKYIESNFATINSIEEVSNESKMGKRQFFRRFKESTFDTPFKYLQKIRIEAAKNKLESTNLTVSEIAFQVGYEEISSFRNVFKKFTGVPPDEYRKKNHLDYWKKAVFEEHKSSL